MSLLSIEKMRKECFVLVGGVNCFGVIVLSSSHITGCGLDRWEGRLRRCERCENVSIN